MQSLAIYGAGGHGRECYWLASKLSRYRVRWFLSDGAQPGESVVGLPVIRPEELPGLDPDALVHLGVGKGADRTAMAARVATLGLRFVTLVDPTAQVGDTVRSGSGLMVAALSVITTDVTIGEHVQINVGCYVHHDCILGDYVTLASRVTIGGNVRVERGAWLGAGCTIINGFPGSPLVIGANAIVGAGAVVIQSVPSETTVVGVPARPR